ncbi:MAG: TOBE domain-containing protein, partial [Roseiflexaceae bacterium]
TSTIAGIVAERSFRGSRTRLTLQHASGQRLEFEIDDLDLPAASESITLALRANAISLIS